MREYYVGITIGPIIETLCLASRPASLWCASAMFSWLTEDMCNRAIDINGDIISPYYPNKKDKKDYSVTSKGVGKYHDRVIFRICDENIDSIKEKVKDVISKSKNALVAELISDKLVEVVGKSKEELTEVLLNYLQVKYIIEEKQDTNKENCILRLSPYLDAAELCPVFSVEQSIQPIMTLFEGRDVDKHNELVKLCFGIKDGNTSLLDQNGKVRDIESIADSLSKSEQKIFNYYAIVQADGDNMGRLLKTLVNDEEVKNFSQQCLNYTTAAADMINCFGGMTIYAGGDDLLFISPLENAEGKNIFQLCAEIAEIFKNAFEDYKENIPTLSFGISINYKRFPLYEALGDALEMLEEAKSVKNDNEEKNKTAVHIRKSSGQSAKFRYTNNDMLFTQMQKLLTMQADTVVLNSMLHKIGLYRPILSAALAAGKDMEETFKNLFDSEYHGIVMIYIQTVRETLEKVYKVVKSNDDMDYSLEKLFSSNSGTDEEISINLLYSLLRTVRFFSEKREAK